MASTHHFESEGHAPKRAIDHKSEVDRDTDHHEADTATDTAKPKPTSELPEFLANATRADWVLWGLMVAAGIYGFALIPFRALLLVNHPFLYAGLSGSNLAVLTVGATHSDKPWHLVAVVIIATLSAAKFLPLYFLLGKRWGKEFVDMMFAGHPPRWFSKLENFIYNHQGFSFLLSCIPFSPISPVLIVTISGIKRARGLFVSLWVLGFITLLKLFYLYLGVTFGTQVQGTLEVINRYITWITIALIAWLFISINLKQRKKGALRK
ncbi:hypothetical protein CMUST_13030 [Corynebacterium mustelae]|uniref:Uncharacterized protein n=1 Tax=Corynebacterium mustelae TaxID=571915 RepID=A0A0G3H6X8_9CORY|nr:hypothetical protein [Corynebacterium mustelae]AKK06902.1 hypothetical protein CMUST_13030 [Corynebacterium mustelae]